MNVFTEWHGEDSKYHVFVNDQDVYSTESNHDASVFRAELAARMPYEREATRGREPIIDPRKMDTVSNVESENVRYWKQRAVNDATRYAINETANKALAAAEERLVGKIEQLTDEPSDEWEARQRGLVEAMNYSPTAQYWKQRAERAEETISKAQFALSATLNWVILPEAPDILRSIKALVDENAKLRALNKELQETIDGIRQEFVRILDKAKLSAPDMSHGLIAFETRIEELEAENAKLRAVVDAAQLLRQQAAEQARWFEYDSMAPFEQAVCDALDALDQKG